MKTVYLSLGSNLGNRAALLQQAVDELQTSGVHINRVSSVYETEPQGLKRQPWYLNVAVEAHTFLFPAQLLTRTQKIERQLKRSRGILNGPRTIDIDIVFYGECVMKTQDLEIPHPRYSTRRFVLAPLAELAPDLRDPVTRERMRDLLAAIQDQSIRASSEIVTAPHHEHSQSKASSLVFRAT
jgi:2-amino-4-hydroxy-6-hydroxymethyldihydropteridine diphosphokinase